MGLVWTRRLRSLNWGCDLSAASGPPSPLVVAVVVVAEVEAAAEILGGIPFIKNSTATSGLPLEARRHARQSDSGKPSALRLLITSAGNSSSVVVVLVVVLLVVVVVVVAAAGAGATAVVLSVKVAGAAAAAGLTSSFVSSTFGFAAAAVFLTLAIMTTKKSDGLILQLSIVASSLRTLPEWINFIVADGRSDLAVSCCHFWIVHIIIIIIIVVIAVVVCHFSILFVIVEIVIIKEQIT